MSRRSKSKIRPNRSKGIGLRNFVHFLLLLIVGLIPHVMKTKTVELGESQSYYFNMDSFIDVFMGVKSDVLLFIGALLLVAFTVDIVMGHIKPKLDLVTYGSGLFGLIIIVSSILSPYQDVVYSGAKDRYESMWIWLTYILIITVARHYAGDDRFKSRLLKVFVGSTALMAVIGISQALGFDPYTKSFLKWLIFPREVAANIEMYTVAHYQSQGAVGSLYNANYLGAFLGMGILSTFALMIKGAKKYLMVPLACLMFVGMTMSKSEAGLLGFALGVAVFIMLLRPQIKSNAWWIGLVLILGMGYLFYFNKGNVVALKEIRIISGAFAGGLVLATALSYVFDIKNLRDKLKPLTAYIFGGLVVALAVVMFVVSLRFLPHNETARYIEELRLEGNTLIIKENDRDQLSISFDLGYNIKAIGQNNGEIEHTTTDLGWFGMVSDTPESYVDIEFYGTGIEIRGSRGENMGIARFILNGELVEEVDLYRFTTLRDSQLISISNLTPGVHVLRVENTGRSHERALGNRINIIDVKAIGIMMPGEHDVSSSGIAYKGNWLPSGSGMYSTTIGNYVDLVFEGSGIDIIASKSTNRGIAKIYLNGSPVSIVDTYNNTHVIESIYKVEGLEHSLHHVRIEVLEERNEASTNRVIALHSSVVEGETDSSIYSGTVMEWGREDRNYGEGWTDHHHHGRAHMIPFDETAYGFTLEAYSGGGYTIKGPFGLYLYFDMQNINFITSYGKLAEIDYPRGVDFLMERSRLFSSRAYIWGRSIPLVMDRPLLGHGADTYLLSFPQNDFIGKQIGLIVTAMVDKPHNLFLNIALSFGLLALVLFGALVIKLFGQSFYHRFKGDMSIHFATFAGMVGIYLISGIFNDSIVPISGIMALIVGLMLGEQYAKAD